MIRSESPSSRSQTPLPITSAIPAARLTLIRSIVAATVLGPFLGTAWLIALWASFGVHPASLVALAIAYVIGTLGVTLGYHRHFAHQSFKTHDWTRKLLVIVGSMSMQGSLLYWVSTHRRHHQFSDGPEDPHSPHIRESHRLGFWHGLFHSHIGWMFSRRPANAVRFAPDIIKDGAIFAVQARYATWAVLGLFLPPLLALPFSRDPIVLLQIFLAAGPLRLLLVHQASWAVGSISHISGARPFDTSDRSANNFVVALFAFGEGLQNNHHAFPRAAYHAHRWWEPDFTGIVIRALESAGLIWDVHRPSATAIAAKTITANKVRSNER